jgi:nicotinamidase-related amidase
VALGFKTHLIEDACRGFNQNDAKAAVEELRIAGVTVVQSRGLLAMTARS